MHQPAADWLGTFSTDLAASGEALTMIAAIPIDVPPRGPHRSNAHRERVCLLAALRWIARLRPALFPANATRQRPNQSPDFVMTPALGGSPIGLEHCDAGLRVYQRWLDRCDDEAPELTPSPNGDEWVGDAPERSFEKQIALAICRKRRPKTWRDAPLGSGCLILVYDKTSTGMLVNDAPVPHLLRCACARAQCDDRANESVLVVRSQERVFAWGAIAKGLV
jgi:hypothetical protein